MEPQYHYIGLDIHKRVVAFCEKRPDGTTIAAGTFVANRDCIGQWAAQRETPWIGGMEATLFTGFVYDVLSPHAVELHVGHPAQLKAISCAKHKSDSIDAETLANLLRADLFPASYMASPLVRELRRVLRYRNFLVRQAVCMKIRTTGILMEVGIPYDSVRIHRQGYFNELIDHLDEVPASVRDLLRTTRSGLEMFQSAQQRLLDTLRKHAHLRERILLLMSIRGVGIITALTWALEIDTPSRFSNLKKAHSYCGLCSGRNESAGKNRRAPLSKQRNSHLQSILIEAAKLAPLWNPQLEQVHASALERGYNRNRATLAVARKLVAYLMAVDQSGKPFDPDKATA
jgi:transposase